MQSSGARFPVELPYVPTGQLACMAEPSGQNPPRGQISPVIPSVGADTDALERQKKPASQGPVGSGRPNPSQY